MKEVFTAKTIEEAKQQASEKFGVSQDKIVFRILEEPKRGLFGMMKKDAQVEALYEPEEEPAPASAPAPVAEPEKAPAAEPIPAAPAAEKSAEAEKPAAAEMVEDFTEKRTPKAAAPAAMPANANEKEPDGTHVSTRGIESEAVEQILEDGDLTPNLKRAKDYVQDIYRQLGVDVTIVVEKTANGIRFELQSPVKSGTIIGRRGETLDSIQYLASIIANKDNEEYCRLLLDSNGYRAKRRRTLEQLAEKIARNVLRSGRSNALEPMNPYERRIIHSRIAGIEGVTSRSVGEDPYRKVIISAEGGARRPSGGRGRQGQGGGYRKNGGNRGGYHGGNGNGNGKGNRRPRQERAPEDFKRSNLDSMKTSFERDYKKPKPEDELNTGLYGKIEL